MANMSYCRFENTYHALDDCLNALDTALYDGTTYDEFVNDLSSDHERYGFKRLLTKCQDFIDMINELQMVEGKQLEDC
jgi:hypothetical protein